MRMKMSAMCALGLLVCGAALTISAGAQTDNDVPHLRKQDTATQLIVDGKPFLAIAGELTNNAATSLPMMEPIWPKLVAGNLNTALVGVSWAQFEPEEGTFNYTQIDGVIAKARENHMHLVILWFGSWKNGTSSFAPYWVKKDYTRFPRIQIDDGKTVSISGPVELLSTFGDATRDADAAAFKALMAHIKEVDGTQHTVLMMQVENEVGVLRDSRDRSPAANRAYAGQVPAELMNYLETHKDHLMPDLRADWAANGYKKSGTWEEVFGPGKPADVQIPLETRSPPMSEYEHEVRDSASCSKEGSSMESGNLPVGSKATMMRRERSWCCIRPRSIGSSSTAFHRLKTPLSSRFFDCRLDRRKQEMVHVITIPGLEITNAPDEEFPRCAIR
jgi:hypothetical protein